VYRKTFTYERVCYLIKHTGNFSFLLRYSRFFISLRAHTWPMHWLTADGQVLLHGWSPYRHSAAQRQTSSPRVSLRIRHTESYFTQKYLKLYKFYLLTISWDRICGPVVRVLGYRSGGPDSIPGATRKIGLERGPLSLVSTTEELRVFDRKVAAPV
jgi:hypothetical protein